MRRLNIFVASFVAVLFTACSTPAKMTDSALTVQVHRQNSTLLDRCQRLGSVTSRGEGSPSLAAPNSSPTDLAIISAEIKARERVVEMGGDTLVLLQTDLVSVVKGFPAVYTMQVQGVALKCN